MHKVESKHNFKSFQEGYRAATTSTCVHKLHINTAKDTRKILSPLFYKENKNRNPNITEIKRIAQHPKEDVKQTANWENKIFLTTASEVVPLSEGISDIFSIRTPQALWTGVEIELTLMAGIPKKIYITKDGALKDNKMSDCVYGARPKICLQFTINNKVCTQQLREKPHHQLKRFWCMHDCSLHFFPTKPEKNVLFSWQSAILHWFLGQRYWSINHQGAELLTSYTAVI